MQLPSNSLQRSRKDRQSALIGVGTVGHFEAPNGAPRSCPAALMAEAGLRWCGVSPAVSNGGSQYQIAQKAITSEVVHSAASRMRRTADDPKTKKTETGLKHARVFARGQQCQ